MDGLDRRPLAALLLLAALLSGACYIEEPGPGLRYELKVEVSPAADPDLVIELHNLNDERFLDENGEPVWDYFQCLNEETCPACGFLTDEIVDGEMSEHWARLVNTRIAELAAEDPNSDFARFDLWCQVPETLGYRGRADPDNPDRADLIPYPDECPDYEVGEVALPLCEAPPPPDSCLAVECDGGPCAAVDFDAVPTGREVTRTVTLTNCGAGGDPVVVLSALRLVPGLGTPPEAFGVRDVEGQLSCLPDPAAEERLLFPADDDLANSSCAFDIVFAPTEPLGHSADLRFRGALPQHEIQLDGLGVSGTATVVPPRVCIEEQVGQPCFGQATVTISNTGPGDLLIEELRIPEIQGDPQNFQLVPPEGPPLPVLLPPDGSTFDLEIQWCDGDPRDETARLEIVTSDPVTPTSEVQLLMRPDCTQGPP